MLSDQGADLVMSYIEHMTMCANGHQSYVHDIEQAIANAMLNHLYDLHKLRDKLEGHNYYWSELCFYSDNHRLYQTMLEMNDA